MGVCVYMYVYETTTMTTLAPFTIQITMVSNKRFSKIKSPKAINVNSHVITLLFHLVFGDSIETLFYENIFYTEFRQLIHLQKKKLIFKTYNYWIHNYYFAFVKYNSSYFKTRVLFIMSSFGQYLSQNIYIRLKIIAKLKL